MATLCLFLLPIAALAAEPAPVPQGEFLQNGVTAHRGDSGNFPENTLPAIEHALTLGVDWIEIDIFQTADGELVVTHDATTGRIGNKDLVVAESSVAELQAVDVATDFRKRKGVAVEVCPPASMPTLRDVLVRIQQQERTRLSIQPKMAVVDEAIALIRDLGAERWVGFNDGDLGKMARVKALAPGIHVFWDRPADFSLEDDLKTASEHRFEGLVVHCTGLTSEKVAAIRAAGFEAGAWTVNDEQAMKHLLNMGVERIYTDYPARLLSLLQE